MSLAQVPKPNYLRVQVTLHKNKRTKQVSFSYTDPWKITHRTGWYRSQHIAIMEMRSHFSRMTGIGRISLVVTQEISEVEIPSTETASPKPKKYEQN